MASSRRNRTRLAVLEAAWKRLGAPGDPAHLEDIAADAKISRQSVYLHFGTRSGLLTALVAHMDETLGLVAQLEKVREIVDPVVALEKMLQLAATYEPKIHGVAMALARLAPTDPDAAAALDDRMKVRHAALLGLLRGIESSGRLIAGWSARQVADVLWTACAPETFAHLVTKRGWSTKAFERWLVHTGRSFLV